MAVRPRARERPENIDEVARAGIRRDGRCQFCRPLRNHSATWPLRSADVEFEITIRRALRQAGYTGATPGGQPPARACLQQNSAHSRESGNPGQRTGSPLSRGRTEESVLDSTPQAETLLSALPFATACS